MYFKFIIELKDLVKLEELILSNNEISEIASGTFVSLASLTRLDLGHNKLATLIPESFVDLKQLSKLLLNNNKLGPALKTSLFANLTELTELYLNGNEISRLNEAFPNPKLKKLMLHGNKLDESLGDHVFKGLDKIEVVSLFGNKCATLKTLLSDGFLLGLETKQIQDEFSAVSSSQTTNGSPSPLVINKFDAFLKQFLDLGMNLLSLFYLVFYHVI